MSFMLMPLRRTREAHEQLLGTRPGKVLQGGSPLAQSYHLVRCRLLSGWPGYAGRAGHGRPSSMCKPPGVRGSNGRRETGSDGGVVSGWVAGRALQD